MQKYEGKALEYYARHNYLSALNAFLKLDKETLQRDDILIMIANCYDAIGEKKSAIVYYKKALRANKKAETAASNLAIIFYELKNFWQSGRYARKALKINPQNASVLVILGNICYCKKKYPQALQFYQKALQLQQNFYTANFNTAGIYFETKDFRTAYFYAKRTCELYPESQEAKAMLANICMELDKSAEALKLLSELHTVNPKDYWVCNTISQACQQQKKYSEALEMGWQAVELSRGENSQHINFGYLLYETALETPTTEVKDYARRWLDKYGQNPIVAHMGKAIINSENVTHVNSFFVKEIFDAFADDFEEVLHNLDYSVPELMAKDLASLFANLKLKKMKILDAGCGTGLCGSYLHKYACFRGLDGVDISSKMLEVAAGKKVYTHLYNQDLSLFLAEHLNTYDLINAADVFTYFGELSSLFIRLAESLHKGGRILFSISENSENDKDYYLHNSGRFLHSQRYVENSLSRQGFLIEKMNRVRLRNEGDKQVWGWIVMALKQI